MTNRCFIARFLISGCLSALSAQPVPAVSTLVGTYCADCHDGQTRSQSNKLLVRFDATQIGQNPEIWASVYRQLQAGTMPPFGAPRPDRATNSAALMAIEQALMPTAGTKPAKQVTSRQIAIRLAALLWNSAPDEALVKEANRESLADPAALRKQARRMLADDRARAFVANFFFPWLQLDSLSRADPDKRFFPEYDWTLKNALSKETELFLLSQLRADGDPIEIWNANYTYLDEQLAKHYGVANISGAQFRRVDLPMPERAGLLGQGSILMITSRHQHGVDAAYTSPATRANWIRHHFLGVPPPTPGVGARPAKPELPITPQTRKLEDNPCQNCHNNFFPLGYALENFDPIGRWRTSDQAGPADASGVFVDGTTFHGVVEMRQKLLQYPDAFRTTITEKLLAYSATGTVNPFKSSPDDLIRARQILRESKPRWSEIIAAVVRAGAESQ